MEEGNPTFESPMLEQGIKCSDMKLSTEEKALIQPKSLIAVCDESGQNSSDPGPTDGDDFSIGAVLVQGRQAYLDLKILDRDLQAIVGKSSYKYKHVQKSAEAKQRIIHTLNHQSGMIRVYGFYAAGGSFVNETKRALNATVSHKLDDIEVKNAKDNLDAILKKPTRIGLSDAIVNSIPSIGHWAKSRNQVAEVYFDQRSDMKYFTKTILEHLDAFSTAHKSLDVRKNLKWQENCPRTISCLARIADILAGDIRQTFRRHGHVFWKKLAGDGYVGRHNEFSPNCKRLPIFPFAHRGWIKKPTINEQAEEPDHLFFDYDKYLINRMISLYSPTGIGCHLQYYDDKYEILQMAD